MSLTTKPKRVTGHKKIQGEHHRHSKNYIKTYWPYIPILAILGLGILINSTWHTTYTIKLSSYTYYDIVETSVGVLALSIFLLRHAFAWHKVLIRGEEFISKHPVLDICLVTLAVSGLVMSRHTI